ncbi:MAG: ABC transporter permease [Oscillospiraceae bacterium]|nr:ABC transporter permease [Oscillospiraceae bacterium]
MGKYFCIQLKRLLRLLLPVLLVTAVLFGCLMVIYDTVSKLNDESEVTTKFQIGVVGTASDFYLQMGLKAISSIDSSRFSVELVEMEETQAESAMRRGKITAFVVFPEGFLDAAFRGDIIPLKFVCAAGSVGLVSMITDEFTQIVETMLIEAQRGIYGVEDALHSLGQSGSQVVNDLSIEYAEFVFNRGRMYRTSTLGAFDGMGMQGYLATGLCTVLILLICLVFSPMMVRGDHALTRMLCAQGRSLTGLVLCDFGVYMLGLLGIAGVVLAYLVFWMEASVTGMMLLKALPVLLGLGAMSFLMYELCSNLISGVLLQFFAAVVLCFVSGCIYPITFFPEAVQKLAAYLPTAMAREQIAHCILQTHDVVNTAALLGYGCVFLVCGVLSRRFKIAGARG